MNKLVPGARFSVRDAREQRLRQARRNGHFPNGDVRSTTGAWTRAAEAFEKNDPTGSKVAELLKEAKCGN